MKAKDQNKSKAAEAPEQLWQILHTEFEKVHSEYEEAVPEVAGDQGRRARAIFVLPKDFETAQKAAEVKAVEELTEAVTERRQKFNEDLSPESIGSEVEKVRKDRPSLFNGPFCALLFQEIHRFVEGESRQRKAPGASEPPPPGSASHSPGAPASSTSPPPRVVIPERAYQHSALCLSGGGIRSQRSRSEFCKPSPSVESCRISPTSPRSQAGATSAPG